MQRSARAASISRALSNVDAKTCVRCRARIRPDQRKVLVELRGKNKPSPAVGYKHARCKAKDKNAAALAKATENAARQAAMAASRRAHRYTFGSWIEVTKPGAESPVRMPSYKRSTIEQAVETSAYANRQKRHESRRQRREEPPTI
jgi:hypothetical protein